MIKVELYNRTITLSDEERGVRRVLVFDSKDAAVQVKNNLDLDDFAQLNYLLLYTFVAAGEKLNIKQGTI